MSYHRRTPRVTLGPRGMSGVTSQPPRGRVARNALGLHGTSLGDDTLSAAASEAQWKADMLGGQQQLIAAQKQWAEGDKLQKWIQIGVTASIPVFGAIWRMLGIGRRRKI